MLAMVVLFDMELERCVARMSRMAHMRESFALSRLHDFCFHSGRADAL